jgi:hypothetical protein
MPTGVSVTNLGIVTALVLSQVLGSISDYQMWYIQGHRVQDTGSEMLVLLSYSSNHASEIKDKRDLPTVAIVRYEKHPADKNCQYLN